MPMRLLKIQYCLVTGTDRIAIRLPKSGLPNQPLKKNCPGGSVLDCDRHEWEIYGQG